MGRASRRSKCKMVLVCHARYYAAKIGLGGARAQEQDTEVSSNEIQPSAASLPSLLASAGVKSFAQHGAAINRALGILSARLRSGPRRHQRARQAPARPSWGAARLSARQMEAHLLPWCPREAKPPRGRQVSSAQPVRACRRRRGCSRGGRGTRTRQPCTTTASEAPARHTKIRPATPPPATPLTRQRRRTHKDVHHHRRRGR
jgi:hypothetical protein